MIISKWHQHKESWIFINKDNYPSFLLVAQMVLLVYKRVHDLWSMLYLVVIMHVHFFWNCSDCWEQVGQFMFDWRQIVNYNLPPSFLNNTTIFSSNYPFMTCFRNRNLLAKIKIESIYFGPRGEFYSSKGRTRFLWNKSSSKGFSRKQFIYSSCPRSCPADSQEVICS